MAVSPHQFLCDQNRNGAALDSSRKTSHKCLDSAYSIFTSLLTMLPHCHAFSPFGFSTFGVPIFPSIYHQDEVDL